MLEQADSIYEDNRETSWSWEVWKMRLGESKFWRAIRPIQEQESAGEEMDAEEEERALPCLEEEVDQLHSHGLYTGPFESAEILPQEIDGSYGTNFSNILGSASNRSYLGHQQPPESCQNFHHPYANRLRSPRKPRSKNSANLFPWY